MSTARMQTLMQSISEWSTKTFKQDKDTILEKLDEELTELKDSKRCTTEEVYEVVDMFHLLLDYAEKCGIDAETLILLTERKHSINKQRKWVCNNGVWKHEKK
jgi:phosphoribosyl-ATP pyrophosphohydrolase